MSHATVQEWLRYLEGLHPTEIELGLQRIRDVAERMGVLSLPAKVVSVSGTNGKGSTIAMMEQLALAHGQSAVVYTSPHILHYNERIRIGGVPVNDQLLMESFTQVEKARGDISLTYFEFGTLSALYLIKKASPDIAILEVGLGGRLDAVNIIDADLAVITTISLDHQDWLGDNLEGIAKEKAGILRSKGDAVIGRKALLPTMEQEVNRLQVNAWRLDNEIQFKETDEKVWDFNCGDTHFVSLPRPQLPVENAALAIAACLRLGVALDESLVRKTMSHAKLTGRFSALTAFPNVRMDVAHNPEAAELLAQNLAAFKASHPEAKVFGVFSVLKDKDLIGIVEPLMPWIDQWFTATLSFPRAQQQAAIDQLLVEAGCRVNTKNLNTVEQAFHRALEQRQVEDLIIVFGSFYTVADVLDIEQRRLQHTFTS